MTNADRSTVADVQMVINAIKQRKISITTSSIQKQLKCSFFHACMVMDFLEQQGIVSPADEYGRRNLTID